MLLDRRYCRQPPYAICYGHLVKQTFVYKDESQNQCNGNNGEGSGQFYGYGFIQSLGAQLVHGVPGGGGRRNEKISTLVGVGSSICGGSAIAATAPVIDADDEEVAQASLKE